MNSFDPELLDLIHGHLDGTLSSDEAARLDSKLSADPLAADLFVRCANLENLLDRRCTRGRIDAEADRLLSTLGIGSDIDPQSPGKPAPVIIPPLSEALTWSDSGAPRFPWPLPMISVFALGVLAALAIPYFLFVEHKAPEQEIARHVPAEQEPFKSPPSGAIGRVARFESDVVIEREGWKQNVAVGMQILATDSLDVPENGGVELALADRSQAKLGPRTMLAFTSAREAILREGFVQIDARNRQADAPLAIVTPDAKAQIRDAWLSMGADRKRTQIRVTEGSVLASRRIDGMEVEIPEGYCSTIARTIDPGPRPSRSGSALLVVSTKTMALGEGKREAKNWELFDQALADRILGDRLWRSATPVRVRTYDELRAEDLEDCSVIVLSVYPLNMGVEQKLIDLKVPQLPIPVVCLETTGFPVLGLTGETQGTDFGFDPGPLVVDIANPQHPLAAGVWGSGLELFPANKRRSYGWGRPPESALTIANIHNRPNHWMLFAYNQGDSMARGTAPARRVGLFIIPSGADYNSPGLDLVDAAIDWCLDSSVRDSMPEMVRLNGSGHSGGIGLLGLGRLISVLP